MRATAGLHSKGCEARTFNRTRVQSSLAMLSLCELRRVAGILERRLEETTLHRIVQPNEFELALSFHGPGPKQTILLSCKPEFARLSSPLEPPEPLAVPLSFAE